MKKVWEHVPAARHPWGGSCLRWQFSGWQLSLVAVVLGGGCPGGICPGW